MRPIPTCFAQATADYFGGGAIDLADARAQHSAYVLALTYLGLEVVVVDPANDLPDSCFVEDLAVVVDGVALLTRSGHPTRRAEAPAVAHSLRSRVTHSHQMMPPATLDGGDVLRVGQQLYVSPSSRTNAAGIATLGQAFPHQQLVVLDLPAGVLHLKCVCSSPAPDLVVVAEGSLVAAFARHQRLVVSAEDAYAANTVGSRGVVLVSAGYPRVAAALDALGLQVHTLETSELRKADGSLTCLSLLV